MPGTPSAPKIPPTSPVVFCYLCPCEFGCGGYGEAPRPGCVGYHADVTKENLLEWIQHVGPSIISNNLPTLTYRHERRAYGLELAVDHEDVGLVAFLLEDFIEETAKRKAVVEACKKANLTLVWTLLQKMRADNGLILDCMLMILKNGLDRGILRQLREDTGDEVYGVALGQFAAIPGSSDRIREAVLEEKLDAKHIPIELALVGGDLELVQFLVEHGCQVGENALAESVRLVVCPIARYFISLGLKINEECFVHGCTNALTHGILECLQHIMAEGMPPYAKRHLEQLFLDACRLGSLFVLTGIHAWLQDPVQLAQKGLVLACVHANESTLELIDLLVSYGADPNDGDAFVAACQSGNVAAVKKFLGLAQISDDLMRMGIRETAEFGHHELLRWLIIRFEDRDILLDDLLRLSLGSYEKAIDEETRSKHRAVLLFLIDIGADVRLDNDRILVPSACAFDFCVASRALELGADPESNDHEAFILASEQDLVWMAVLLADHGADLQARNNFAIRTAARLGSFAFFRFLSEKGGDMTAEDYDCFKLAVEHGNLNIIQLIWETGVSKPEVNRLLSPDVIKSVIESGDLALVSFLIGQCRLRVENIPNILVSAVRSKSFEIYGLVRDAVASTWKLPDKIAALEASIESGCYDIFHRLLGYTCKMTDGQRLKLFMMAVEVGNSDMMRHLIVPIIDPGPLMIALVESARLGHFDSVKFLLEHSPSVYTKACLADALRVSITSRHICVIELLLSMQDVDSDPRALALQAIQMDTPGIFVMACRIGADLKALVKEVPEESVGPLVSQAIQDIRDGFIRTRT